MRRMTHVGIIGICLLLLLGGCGSKSQENRQKDNGGGIPTDPTLSARVDSCAKRYSTLGRTAYYVYDLTADKAVCGQNENELMPSASCLKLLSGMAGLKLLGTDYLYDTKLYIKGVMQGDTLNGCVALKTGLDPQLQEVDIQLFCKKLKARGIHYIKGDVLLDATLHNPITSEEHWYPGDLHFARYGLLYKGSDRVLRVFQGNLRAQRIAFDASRVQLGTTPKGSLCLFRFRRSIDKVIERMWRNSSNTQSTGLLLTMGQKVHPEGDFAHHGVAYLRQFVKETLGRTDSCAVVHDGCGLCTYNRMTPALLVDLLRLGYHDRAIYTRLRSYLPIAGKTGSMRREMTRGIACGKIQAKTGTLSNPYGISTLSGYCTGSNGHQLCFSIMSCEMSVLDARVIQQKLCETLLQ